MAEKENKQPVDTQLLSDAIYELNISRHNVAIYPKGHPLIEKSLNRCFDFLQQLFELRDEISIAVAKGTLVFDEYFFDKKNAVYREIATSLNNFNIASVTFISGMTKDELYSFNLFLSEDAKNASKEFIEELLKKYNLIHIKVGFIDYSVFYLDEGRTEKGTDEHLLERYVFGLLEGRFQTTDVSDVIYEIPPEELANLLNKADTDSFEGETYERLITTYVKKSSERAFSGKELKKLLDFINALRPELKKQFLSSAVGAISRDKESLDIPLGDISVESVIGLLNIINEQKLAIPEALRNLLEKLSKLKPEGFGEITYGEGYVADDIFLSPDVISLFEGGEFKTYVSDTYQREIQRLLRLDASKFYVEAAKEYEKEWSDEHVERCFNQTILELVSADTSNIILHEEHENFVNLLKEQLEQFINTGQYEQVLKIAKTLESNVIKNRFPDIASEVIKHFNSQELVSLIVDSFRIMGRQFREEAMQICEYYGERIIPALIDALVVESSQTIRSFLINLVVHLGDKAIPEAARRLDDSKWFVKRNMLFILGECGGEEALHHIRRYCRYGNPKVSFQALRYLLKVRDSYGIKTLEDYLGTKSEDVVEMAISISGALGVKEVVPDLISMLEKRAKNISDYDYKISVVKALGQIGDSRALDTLRNILSSRSLFFMGAHKKLKEEVYRTLKNYPYEDVKDLIETGVTPGKEK